MMTSGSSREDLLNGGFKGGSFKGLLFGFRLGSFLTGHWPVLTILPLAALLNTVNAARREPRSENQKYHSIR